MRLLAIDPGSDESAWLEFDDDTGSPVAHAKVPNDELVSDLRRGRWAVHVVVIEKIESFGMAVGREVFDTVHWSGRFTEAARPTEVAHLTRRRVKTWLCGSAKAKDANVRIALLDRFGGPSAKGTKAAPGPLYGIAADVWSALAIAVTYAETGGQP